MPSTKRPASAGVQGGPRGMVPTMSEAHRYTILAAVDGSDASLMVLEQAINVAARYPDVDFQVASVLHIDKWRSQEVDEEERQGLQRRVAAYLAEALGDFEGLEISSWRLRIFVRAGHVREELPFLAEWSQADLVVIGRDHLSGESTQSSGATQAVLDHVNCPVLVVKPKEHRPVEEVEYHGSGRELGMTAWLSPHALPQMHGGVY